MAITARAEGTWAIVTTDAAITIPAGATVTGKVHSTEHIFMVIKGDITLVTEHGRKRVQGPYQCVCAPGTKRAGHAHTDVVCTNIHITDETDLTALELLLIDNSDNSALGAPEEPHQLGE